MKRIISLRTRFFFTGEGQNDQSLVKWYQRLCNQQGLHVHLDYEPLDGGGYKKMLEETIRLREKNERETAEKTFLLVDEDRALRRDDPWSIETLKRESKREDIIVCVQCPNIEGFFLRLFPKKESLNPSPQDVDRLLKKEWSDYSKRVDADTIGKKFTLKDLLRLAKADPDLEAFLSILGLKK